MSDLGPVIDDLVKQGTKPVAASRPAAIFLQWLVVTLLSTAIIVCFMQPRADLETQLASPLYLGEIASLLCVPFAAALSAVWLCYPDLRQKPRIIWLPVLPIAIFALLSLYRALHPELTLMPPPEKVHGIDCASCVIAFAIVPGLWMLRLLYKHATPHPRLAGAMSFIASASIGIFALKLVEANDSVAHLLVWHASPMLLLACLGALFGKKYLSW